jgi:haloalkane dehalogenase
MQRRDFIEMAAGALAAGAIAGPTRYLHRAARRRFVETPQGRIAYLERGTGEAALFLHGFPLSGYQWRGALERLAARRRCLAPDFLGLGYTEVREDQSVAPDDQVAMLIAFLDRLSIPKVDLVASDSGGAVAQLVVARHPHRVRTLLLANCDAEIDSPPPALQPILDLSKQGKFVDEWLAPWLADKKLARSERGIGGMCYTDPAHPTDDALDDYFSPLVSSARRKALVHAYAISLERNPLAGMEPILRRSTVPARIVWGTGDTIFSAESPGYLDRTFGASRGVRRLEGKKLFWPEELPEVVAEEARRLWGV